MNNKRMNLKTEKIYIFVYNVVSIKLDFSRLKSACANQKFILIGSAYCLRDLSTINHCCFDAVHTVSRDFHQVDYRSIEQIIKDYIQKYGAQNIRLMTNEDSTQIACAKIREKYAIPGDTVNEVLPFVDKTISKTALGNCVKKPEFLLFEKSQYITDKETYLDKIKNKLGFPVFAKPIDSVSSIETYKINDFSDLKDIADKIITSEYQFEIDQFINGDLFHCDIILNKGTIKFFMVGKYAFPLAYFSKGWPMGSIPVIEKRLYNKIHAFAVKVLKKLKCKTGAYHIELFLEIETQELIFLEIAARTPGALLPMSYEVQFGINIEELHYLAHMELLDNFEIQEPSKFAGWVTYPQNEGVVIDIKSPEINVQHQFTDYVAIGQVLKQSNNLLDASCSVIFWDNSIEKIQSTFDILKNYQPIKYSKITGIINQSNKPKLNLEHHFEIMEELFNTLPYVFWKDRDGRYLGCNENQAKAFQLNSISEFIGKTAYEVLGDSESAKLVEKIDNEIMDSGKGVILEETLSTPEGKKTYLSQKQPIRDNNGVVIGLLGCAMDITQIKEEEKLAKEQQEKFQIFIKEFAEAMTSVNQLIDSFKHEAINTKIGKSQDILTITSIPELTKRETDVLYYLTLGKAPKEIAGIISILDNKVISPKSIQAVIDKQLYPKFDVYNTGELTEKARIYKVLPFLLL